MRSFLTKPAFWLALQMLAVIGGIHVRDWDVVHEVPDSESYKQTGSMPPAQMLASIRTVGYPLFLRAVGWASPGLRILPQVHLAFHLFAVVLFYWALHYLAHRRGRHLQPVRECFGASSTIRQFTTW